MREPDCCGIWKKFTSSGQSQNAARPQGEKTGLLGVKVKSHECGEPLFLARIDSHTFWTCPVHGECASDEHAWLPVEAAESDPDGDSSAG